MNFESHFQSQQSGNKGSLVHQDETSCEPVHVQWNMSLFCHAGTLLDVALQCGIDFRLVSQIHLRIQNHIYDYKISPTYPIDNNLPPGGRALLSNLRMWTGWCDELQKTGTLNGIPQRVNSWRASFDHSA